MHKEIALSYNNIVYTSLFLVCSRSGRALRLLLLIFISPSSSSIIVFRRPCPAAYGTEVSLSLSRERYLLLPIVQVVFRTVSNIHSARVLFSCNASNIYLWCLFAFALLVSAGKIYSRNGYSDILLRDVQFCRISSTRVP